MASQNSDAFSLERIPDIARPVIIAAKQDAAGD